MVGLEDTYWLVGHGPNVPVLTDVPRFLNTPGGIYIFWNNRFAEPKRVLLVRLATWLENWRL